MGYFPEAVAVNLLVNGTRLSKVAKNEDGTYSSVEWFPFTPKESDEGTEIACEVQHATLKHPIAEKVQVHLTEEESRNSHILATVLGSILFLIIVLGFIWYKRKEKRQEKDF
nr:PREDICTED: signal-regulatory protein gamma-like [Latimeria chalumnae]|eukprot:XP_014349962.1 PREDICTED: signal-regulatory protein gamma-like [Latimeria chalumnae]